MSKLLPSVTGRETTADAESQLPATEGDDASDGADDTGGSRWRRRAVYAAGGLGAALVYRRLRGRDATADTVDADEGSKTGRSLKRRVGGRAGRLAAGFVAASVTKRLLRRWQR
ncbi:hypothetical protein ABSL23_12290 [Halobacterium sp. NMX12-1]|uniref:DUF4235 domain-containing protein n=1 Tax=Halobacterium sp. NMX12-1 TaxID=3166650 RepID=A0AAU8CCM9_9EURY